MQVQRPVVLPRDARLDVQQIGRSDVTTGAIEHRAVAQWSGQTGVQQPDEQHADFLG
jgi:hypothetical protein